MISGKTPGIKVWTKIVTLGTCSLGRQKWTYGKHMLIALMIIVIAISLFFRDNYLIMVWGVRYGGRVIIIDHPIE